MPAALRKLMVELSADRKRLGLLCALVLVGLLLWARIILISNVPKTAVADPPAGASAPAPDAPEAGTPVAPAQQDAQRVSAPAASDNRMRETTRIELARLPDRDPFAINADHFPPPVDDSITPPDRSKPVPNRTEDPRAAASKRAAVLKALVEGMKLEAVMRGTPMAVIDGRTYLVGAGVPAGPEGEVTFVLRKVDVENRSVALECEGHRFDLRMSTPDLN